MISINNLYFQYPKSEFSIEISELSVAAGERLAIVGPSGSGKTTLLSLIAGIVKPQRGTLSVCGNNVDQMNDQQRRQFRISEIGFVFQRFELVDYLNVRDNIALPYLINRSLKLTPQIRAKVNQLAEKMAIQDLLRRHPNKLSQGEKQRVAICRALITSPQLILADEPTGHLDPANKQIILDLFFEQLSASDRGLVVVTHDMAVAQQCDRVVDFSTFHTAQMGASF